jgi:hypothetical protein
MPFIKKSAMKGFVSDWREAFVISGCYGMGDPLARSAPTVTKSHSQGPAKAAVVCMKLIPMSEDREQRRGEACPPARAAGEAGGHHPYVTP